MNDVIKSYLVSLGFGVDESSLGKFNKAIQDASTRVLALYGAVQTAAAGIFFGIAQISKGFEDMGYEYKIIAPAINKALILRRELLRAYSSAGVNLVRVVQQSVKFNLSLTKTQYALKAIYTSVASRFFPLLTKQLDNLRQKLYSNMPRIQESLEKFIKFIFKAFEATVILGARVWSILERVYDFFVQLDKATNGWSTVVLGLIAAWRLLNLSFLATPLGMLIAGITALIALYDDFKVWKEGGKSLFDWANTADKWLIGLVATLSSIPVILAAIRTAVAAVNLVAMINPWVAALTVLAGLIGYIYTHWEAISKFFGGKEAVLNNITAPLQSYPALGNLGGNMVNQNVNQQTSISVQGSADANSTGKMVTDQQSRVNFDMTRNLKGATR